MFHIGDAKRALKVDAVISGEMQRAIELWENMFLGKAPWLNDTTKSLGLPAAIVSEVARLTTFEMESEVTGSQRADWLQGEYQRVLDDLSNIVESACAGGSVVLKPYRDGDRIVVDVVDAWRFVPTSFNSRGEITGAVFAEPVAKGKVFYTRLEHHMITDEGYVIRNVAFRSHTQGQLGTECPLSAVDEWADLEPEMIIGYKNGEALDKMLFAYFKLPLKNTVDAESPLGVSVYSRATGLIEQADKQYSRILWEYEGSELAIDASYGALRAKDEHGKDIRLPERQKRLFRQLAIDSGQSGDLYKVFSPTIRDQSLFNGLDKLLKRIEFNCGLAYGTLSDPQNVDKTAEEIRSSKQRSYAMVCAIQKKLQATLEHLLWCMDFYATGYKLAPRGNSELNITWGDGILQDVDKEYARRVDLVERGLLKPEKLMGWYFGVSDEEALNYMPDAQQAPTLELE